MDRQGTDGAGGGDVLGGDRVSIRIGSGAVVIVKRSQNVRNYGDNCAEKKSERGE